MTTIDRLYCSICHDWLDSSQPISTTFCKHVFHQNCLSRWSSQSPTCPTCRGQISSFEGEILHFSSRAFALDETVQEANFRSASLWLENQALKQQILILEQKLRNQSGNAPSDPVDEDPMDDNVQIPMVEVEAGSPEDILNTAFDCSIDASEYDFDGLEILDFESASWLQTTASQEVLLEAQPYDLMIDSISSV
ncbi:hypothetical protein L596_013389 [Steinernema carpocapsae]|uniref:RING-type domain-containing protein n=1 Tax=Steinernema carpocapsae TaxID=34508 RepID=A0A4U5P0V6_STECR|nr:hypothetical protein L596_013389 [Steinernema carpocapsae]